EIGVETGGSNIQFAVDPRTGRMVAIEMNPRVSRSSALASKATGFPIAKIATKLAVGYTLDEIPNDITKETPACFEPSIDYCVVKAPKFNFRKFPGSDDTLTTFMKSVGEVMSIGRTFKEALQKALAALEIRSDGFGLDDKTDAGAPMADETLRDLIRRPTEARLFAIHRAFSRGWNVEDVAELSGIDPWFLDNLKELVEFEGTLRAFRSHEEIPPDILRRAKRLGYTDAQLARLCGRRAAERDILEVRSRRRSLGGEATFKLVDTCAAEFEAYTPYYYSTYEHEDESRSTDRPKVIILGGGPNRIGQGIEFDYCCVHAAFSLREEGYETIMVNSNPETVSTDYDTSDKLYFEPLTLEHVLNIWERERPEGVILQLGGQTPLNIGRGLVEAGARILGTSYDSIDLAEDRERFRVLVEDLGLRQPPSLSATTLDDAVRAAERVGYPVLVRPSFVLSGEAMRIVYDRSQLEEFWGAAIYASQDKPVLIDKFLEDATEVDVDAIADGERVVIGGIMEHIEQAGVHSGDSSCAIPTFSLSRTVLDEIRRTTRLLGEALRVRGLMNIQYAVQNGVVYILEVNPRASRTVPFVSKSIGVPLAKLAAKVMVGRKLKDLGFTEEVRIRHVSVKSPVFPFGRFPGFDPLLGPEMKSTGEVMGIDDDFGTAYAKAFLGAGYRLPLEGTVFVSVMDADKKFMPPIVRDLQQMGFRILATRGTRRSLELAGLAGIEEVLKVTEGSPSVRERIASREISLIINTPKGAGPRLDDSYIRALSIALNIPCITTVAGARAVVDGIRALRARDYGVLPLQEYFPRRPR
ncbi:MAG: carbamoyl-phosphate synthase large subunit, partial [Planctomycetes bacterium]|nr:carbamoyl-phosphate synthase large subunit [Planctomycetota bacterium]